MRGWQILLIAACCLPAAHGIMVKGDTRGGMRFAGVLSGVADGILSLELAGHPESRQLGIPIAGINRLQLLPEDGQSLLSLLEGLPDLLPLLEAPARASLLEDLRAAAAAGDWPLVRRWCERLLEPAARGIHAGELRLLRAWALYEMGLRRQAAAEADALAATTDPLAAPARLCWLQARLAAASGDHERLRYWAGLPLLQIPACTGPLAAELRQLAATPDPSRPFHQPQTANLP